MILGIEASSIRGGGGATHLKELLRAFDPQKHRFARVVVWSGKAVLAQLPDAPWLKKQTHWYIDRGLVLRLFWQRFLATRQVEKERIDVLFVPGGLHHLQFRPLVTMSHNMLPFDLQERDRYGLSYFGIRLRLLEWRLGRVFTSADGVIFLTYYALNNIAKMLKTLVHSSAVVPHGVGRSHVREPRRQEPISAYSKERPFEILYVSTIDVYKHQRNLVRVVARLREEGLPVRLRLVGPDYAPERALLDRVLREVDARGEVVEVVGAVPYEELPPIYHAADLFVFASSCENLPIILLEAMAAGLPIACSGRGPMPEILEDGGEYFDPEDTDDIYRALKRMLNDAPLRQSHAEKSFALSKPYTWEACADATFAYLESFARGGSSFQAPGQDVILDAVSTRK
jgi:glycosyltransferase involved in cell wall biosynthesis